MNFQQIILLSFLSSAFAFQSTCPKWNTASSPRSTTTMSMIHNSNNNDNDDIVVDDRRSFMNSLLVGAAALSTAILLPSAPANAGIDPAMLKSMKVEGDVSGTAQRLRQIEEIQRPVSDTINMPYEELPSGVQYREYREGKGEAVIQNGSKVAAEVTIRCKSFSTQKEPGGLKYYSTKLDTEFDELAWTIGSGELPPGLEEAMMGMHRNGVRRIEVPTTQVFAARNENQLPLPTTKDGKRLFERLFKTEASLIFEVLVTRIK